MENGMSQSYGAGCGGSAARCCRTTGILLVDINFCGRAFLNNQIMGENGRIMGWNMGYFFLFFFLFKLDTCFEEMWLKLQLTMDGLLTLDSLVGVFRDMKWTYPTWAKIYLCISWVMGILTFVISTSEIYIKKRERNSRTSPSSKEFWPDWPPTIDTLVTTFPWMR